MSKGFTDSACKTDDWMFRRKAPRLAYEVPKYLLTVYVAEKKLRQ